MKKINALFFVVALCLMYSSAYCQSVKKGNKLINASLGLNSYYLGTPIGVTYESVIQDNLSVGAMFDYNTGDYGSSSYNWGYTAYYAGARGAYHLADAFKVKSEKVDLYAGIGLGYQSFKWKDNSYGVGYSYSSGLYINYFIGGKYYFTSKVGGMLELGSVGLSSARVGLAIKL